MGQEGTDRDEFRSFVAHLQILSPVLLSLSAKNSAPCCEPLIAQGHMHMLCDMPLESESVERAAGLLDRGLPLAYFTLPHTHTEDSDTAAFVSSTLSAFPKSRVGLCLAPETVEELLSQVSVHRSLVHGFLIRVSETLLSEAAALLQTLYEIVKDAASTIELFVQLPQCAVDLSTMTQFATKNERIHVVATPSFREETSPLPLYFHHFAPATEKYDSVDLYTATLRSDRADGLFTTLVCDEAQTCLGLVYSNTITLRIAFLTRRGVYWSRSRQEIWHKGDSSGMIQTLHRMRHDCDRDAVQMIVHQHGEPAAFCHLQCRTCFGEDHGLTKLERTLQDRLRNAPEGSYTKRLYNDEQLLQQKLLEEVQELVEAKEKEDIASEAADVLYFLMVRCVAAGVSLADIERNLDMKSMKTNRRPGHAKEWRTKEAQQILQSAKTDK